MYKKTQGELSLFERFGLIRYVAKYKIWCFNTEAKYKILYLA